MRWVILIVLLYSWEACGQDAARDRVNPAGTSLPAKSVPDYRSISSGQRLRWFANSTTGPVSLLLAGPLSSAWGTMLDRPREYGPHWGGFADRYGMRITGISTGNAIEAALGSVWGEDPRYFRSPRRGFGTRTRYVIWSSFLAPHRDGTWHPAYARFAGNLGNNFLSNTWRVPSERGPGEALLRCVWGVVGDLGGNAFNEFWPDVKRKAFGK